MKQLLSLMTFSDEASKKSHFLDSGNRSGFRTKPFSHPVLDVRRSGLGTGGLGSGVEGGEGVDGRSEVLPRRRRRRLRRRRRRR